MPHKKDFDFALPHWAESISDECLQEVVSEALFARKFAIRQGAESHCACKRALESGDKTLEQIALGKVHGVLACKKAADALRKYNTAGECAQPSASRCGVKRR